MALSFKPLSQIESHTYEVVRDYLKKYREIDLEALLPYCYKALGRFYQQEKITNALYELIKKRYFIRGSSLTHNDILQNTMRKNILQYIQMNPGAYNRLIRRELQIGSNEFNWHIGMLEKFNFIKKIHFDRSFGYFENRSYMGHELDLFLIQNEKSGAIIRYLESHPKASLSQIAKGLEMHYSTVQKHIEILTERKLVIPIQDGRHNFYDYNEELMQKIRKIINGAVFVEFAV